jgi:hypothetical protein
VENGLIALARLLPDGPVEIESERFIGRKRLRIRFWSPVVSDQPQSIGVHATDWVLDIRGRPALAHHRIPEGCVNLIHDQTLKGNQA